MTDDIVTRLRLWDDQQPPFKTMNEAADEIKRLRSALDAEGNEANLLMLEIERLRAEKAELLEAIRLTAEYYLPPALDNWEWWKVYSKYADPEDAQRIKDYCDKAMVQEVRGD
jgi:hypothetical protein